ncbi:MAG TPA: chorismate-binding protein [Verrucomicrobiae bacterium]|nr:chorismate-binding protein [Verrucomicrobiae bacterium]
MSFRVLAGVSPAALFERPARVVRAAPGEHAPAFDDIEAALRDGAWAAGYVEYGGALAIGLFDAPREIEIAGGDAAHAPLLALVGAQDYADHVRALQRAIYDGDVYQVNYTIPFALATSADPLALYARYAHATQARYQAYVEDGERAILSWSPELFLSFDGDRVRTKPMKGTASLDRIDELCNEKNRAEHVMIVDLLRNDLRRVCEDVALEAFLEVERYPSFATMTSTIAGRLRAGTTLAALFAAAFPCGSVTGAPKRAAMRFIAEREGSPRGPYCGAIGFLSPQRRGWWNVAIRTATLDRASGSGRYHAGGGIVADSDPAGEWREIALKCRFLQPDPSFAILETFASDASEGTLAAHAARMERSAAAFGIVLPEAARAQFAPRDARTLVRLRLGLDGSLERREEPLAPPVEPVPVGFAGLRVRGEDPFLAHKTSWRPAHDAAAAESAARGWFDALLENELGELTEGWRSTLFFELDGTLWTPPQACGLLPGVLRAQLLREGRVRERRVTAQALRRAQAVYVGNSARGLLRATLLP